MGLFDKKYCDVCGEKIGLLGNRKLEDGNLCRNCAAKLSPWFSDRRRSTVEEIKEQLSYREENLEKVKAFHATRTLGEDMKVILDEDAGTFVVTRARDLEEANPDVLSFSDVTGCNLDIDEMRTEIQYRDKEGKRQSFSPRRYACSYNFSIVIHVNNPYFDEIRFRLNASPVDNDERTLLDSQQAMREQYQRGPVGRPGAVLLMNARPDLASNKAEVMESVEYRKYEEMGREIREALLQVRQEARDNAAAAAAPKTAVTCPFCGATTVPDANGRCEYCGGALT